MTDARESTITTQLGKRPRDEIAAIQYDAQATALNATLCPDLGHVWLSTDGTPYSRIRGRKSADVPVICQYCSSEAVMPGTSQFSGKRGAQPVDLTIPPQFKTVLDRALADIGSVPKSP